MDKYVVAPPSGSTNNSVGAVDRPWTKGYFDELPGWQEYLAESTGYGIVSGCEPTISGLTVSVASGVVHLANGTRKEIAASTVTLDAADASNPRIDLVYITAAGAVAKITGTAAATPSAPSLPANGISVARVSVAANATTGTMVDERNVISNLQTLPFVNVKDFGAIGNGSADDTLAFLLALTKSEYVYVPSGTYKIKGLNITKNAYFLGGNNAILSPIIKGTSRFYNMITADGSYNIVFDNINFIGLGTLPTENIDPVTALSFNGLESFTCTRCVFSDFRQMGHITPAPATLDGFIPSLVLNVDCTRTIIDNCVFGTNGGGLEIWIDRDSVKINTQFTIRNSMINPSDHSPFDVRKTVFNSLNNIYIADYATYPAGGSIINAFSDVVNIDGDYWDGNAYNMYDNTEQGMYKGREFRARNISVSSTFTVDSPFLVNAINSSVENIDMYCRVFFFVDCKNTNEQLWARYNLNIINCYIRPSEIGIMVGYGTTTLDININVQSSAILPQTLESDSYVGVFYLARPNVNLKISDSRIRCTKPYTDTAYSLFYIDDSGHSLNVPAMFEINNCQIQTDGAENTTRLFTIKNSSNTCYAMIGNCYSSVKIGNITDDYSKVLYKESNNTNIDNDTSTTKPTSTSVTVVSFQAQRSNNYITLSVAVTADSELAANTLLFTIPEKFRLNSDYGYFYDMAYSKRYMVKSNGQFYFTGTLPAGTYYLKLVYPA